MVDAWSFDRFDESTESNSLFYWLPVAGADPGILKVGGGTYPLCERRRREAWGWGQSPEKNENQNAK